MAVLVIASTAACSAQQDAGGPICTALFAYGLSVGAVDSATGAPASSGITAIATDGAYSDSATAPATASNSFLLGLAGERAGTYTVTVRKAGYSTWTKNGIVVTRDECHVHGVAVTAKLQPAA